MITIILSKIFKINKEEKNTKFKPVIFSGPSGVGKVEIRFFLNIRIFFFFKKIKIKLNIIFRLPLIFFKII
jgi:hypothetical protein